MIDTSTIILSSNQTHRLHHEFFIPMGDVCATLLIVHGMSEHGGRYAKFAKFLANHGVLVATYDQLGHGQTAKNKDEFGFFDEKYPMQTLCKDVIIMANKLKNHAKILTKNTIPHFIMGHSMGSFIVRTVLTHHATSFHGAILMGVGNRFGVIGHLAKVGFAALNRLNPKYHNTHFAYFINQNLLTQIRSPISSSPFAWLSENLDNIQNFENDPLCGFAFTNNGFYTLSLLIKQATSSNWYGHLPHHFAMLLVSGKDDPVGDMGQDVIDLADILLNNGTSCTTYLYPNMRHEPLHETNHVQVYQDILAWICKISQKSTTKMC